MQNPSTPKTTGQQFVTRVMQGVMIGTVLAVPVAIWAYTQAVPQPHAPTMETMAATAKANRKPVNGRKPMRVKEAQTIPASQMHLRIDDGRRPQAPVEVQSN